MALGDFFIEEIEINNSRFRVAPLAVEPVNDIAVLGKPDIPKYAMEFEDFCEKIKPVPLCTSDFALFEKFNIHIYTHKRNWVTGLAQQCSENATTLFIEADEPIEGGTSGGPVINDLGELVGIVSQTLEDMKGRHKPVGPIPRPHLTLPVWVCRRILGRNFS
jgi:CBS domain-containing protein